MTTVVPTFSDQVSGEELWCRFDYYQNPTPVLNSAGARANPCLFFGHTGGGTLQDHRAARDSGDTLFWHLFRWLLQNQGAQNSEALVGPALHWDLCGYTSGQRKHKNTIRRTRAIYTPESILDWLRIVAQIKARHAIYGFDPDKCGHLGESYRAMISQLALLGWPPALAGAQDSTFRFNIFAQGPIDLRTFSGVDFFHYSRHGEITGVRADAGDSNGGTGGLEWDLVPTWIKNRLSIRWYYEQGLVGGHVPTYIAFPLAGDGVQPLGNALHVGSDPHDSSQAALLAAAMAAADCAHEVEVLLGAPYASLINAQYPSEPTDPVVLAQFNRFADFMAPFGV